MVFISSEEYKELLEYKFKYELEHNGETCEAEKPVEEEQSEEVNEEPREFKVGDKAKFVKKNDFTDNGFYEGDIVEIIELESGGTYPIIIKNQKYTGYVNSNQLELVEEREEN